MEQEMNTLKHQKRRLSRKSLAIVVTTLVSNIVSAQSLPSTTACNSLTRASIAAFRASVGTDTTNGSTGAVKVLKDANSAGQATRTLLGGSAAGAWNTPLDLLVIADRLDENAFLAPPCKSMFYPSGVAVANNIHACFRGEVTPQLEHAMYSTTLHAYYNYQNGYASAPSAKLAFNAIRDLLRKSRTISNTALTCLLETPVNRANPPLVGP
jgi:hypothetical protein